MRASTSLLDWFEQKCIGYTLLSSYGFSARLIEEGAWFERAGNFIFPLENVKIESILAIANSLVSQFILRQLNPTMNFEISDLQRIPYIEFDDQVSDSIKEIIELKKENSALDLNSQDFWPAMFSGYSLTEIATKVNGKIIENEFNQLKIQGEIDKQIMLSMRIKDSEIQVMCSVVGTPIWYEEFYTGDWEVEYPSDTRIEKHIYSTNELNIYEATNTLQESRVTFPDLFSDILSAFTLRLLGHRWPKQIEANEPVPAWAEPSGIIPLTASGHSLPTLLDRVRDRLAADFPNGNPASIEREFADIVGEKLADWLAGSFYTRHISQFKKRPIAWQVQTSPAPGQRQRGGPAFAALLYYHKLSADLLPTLRNQLVRDLTRAYETEQRTLRRAPGHSQSLTGDQEARLRQLDIWLAELQAFSDALQFVSDHGFGDTPAQLAALRQFALDDAMQSLKAAWLGRLAAKATSDALPDWQTRADKTGIHPALRDWIAAATANLAHHCAQVGAPAPKAAKLKTDPDARALAVIIGTQAKEMVAQSLKLAGDAWFSELDAHVLRPLLDEINDLKAQQAALETVRETLAAQDTRALYANEQAIKSLKATIRKKTKTRSDYRKTANELREHIESWRCPAAATWTDWLGQQPLFDAFASLDGQRQPPQTIADFVMQESRYAPDINDGVRVNIAPLQKAGLLATDVLAAKDVDKAIADRAEWRADERRWCREGKLPRPGWWA